MSDAEQLEQLSGYTDRLGPIDSPAGVLDALHDFVSAAYPLCVHGAAHMSSRFGGWDHAELGRNVFIHDSVPDGWWEEYLVLGRKHGFDPALMMARSQLIPFTWTETMQHIQPLGQDRRTFDLALKYGMRDGLTCPLGGRWVVAFWSKTVIASVLSRQDRIIIYMAANLAALRIDEVTEGGQGNSGDGANLTNREVAVLRLASLGHKTAEIAQALEIGSETARSHFKKAQRKLGAKDRVHAVAEAIRQGLLM